MLLGTLVVLGATKRQANNWLRESDKAKKITVAEFLWQQCVSVYDVAVAINLVRKRLALEPTAKELRSNPVKVLLRHELRAAMKERAKELNGAWPEPNEREVQEIADTVTIGIRSSALYRAYKSWCASNSEKRLTPLSAKAFSDIVNDLSTVYERTFGRKHLRGWLGIGLRKGVADS